LGAEKMIKEQKLEKGDICNLIKTQYLFAGQNQDGTPIYDKTIVLGLSGCKVKIDGFENSDLVLVRNIKEDISFYTARANLDNSQDRKYIELNGLYCAEELKQILETHFPETI
jgi:hypothetical protein